MEGLFFIKTLKMGIIYNLHFFLQNEKPHFLKGHNAWSYQYFATKFFLVVLQVLPFQKIIVGKISHGGPINYIQFEKNRLKVSFLLYKFM